MPLILKEEEKKMVLDAIECYAEDICAEYRQTAKDFLDLLEDNSDCTVWITMTKEEFEELP